MRNDIILAAVAVLCVSCARYSDRIDAIIPAPVEVQRTEGTYKFNGNCKAVQCTVDPECGLPAEGYSLSVTPEGICITAADEAGIFYGKQTLRQMLPVGAKTAVIPCVEILDWPRFRWRGYHVDPCRHFMSIEDTKKQIDVLSQYKINVMHWHLTDDQGWRIEIKKYPKLTEIGGSRTEFDGSEMGGWYSQEEIAEVVKYAAERHITVVPEIEMPGHSFAAIRAYPELSCEGKPMGTFYTWGSPDVVLCPGKELVFEYLEDVVREVVELFPSEYIHIGGDECRKGKWAECPLCQARIAAEGLVADSEGTAEEKLQSYAVKRMETILAKYGKKLVGWDEILEGGLSPDATVMSWRGESGGITSAKQGHDVIMTPSHDGLYLDHFQGDPKIEPVAIGRYTTLEKIYSYNPVPAVLEELGLGERVLGVQANTWSEYLYTEEQREYMMYPRALALAEIAWTPLERKDWERFRVAADAACENLEKAGVTYHIPLPEQPGGSCDHLAFTDSIVVAFQTTRPEKMVYTLDGKTPKQGSTEYTEPLCFTEDATIRIRTVLPWGKMSKVRTIEVKKSEPAPATAVENVVKGLDVKMVYGCFNNTAEFEAAPADAERKCFTVEKTDDFTNKEPWTNSMQNIRFYGTQSEGYIYIPRDGVWRFSTDNDQFWIDGKLAICNDGECKRFSRNDIELVLEKGYHPVRLVFLSNVVGGWTTARNNGRVLQMGPGDDRFHTSVFYREDK